MINKEIIEQRILEHSAEMEALQKNHDQMVEQFKQAVTQNQSRFAQLAGALAELRELSKHEQPDMCSGNGEPSAPASRVSGAGGNPGDYLGTPVVRRELDQPGAASGETCAGNRDFDSRGPLGHGRSHG